MTLVQSVHATPALQPFCVDDETRGDVFAREALLDAAFGPARFRKTCQKLRAGRRPADGLSLVVRDGALVGTVRLWHVAAGGVPALMLGPLAVDDSHRSRGLGGLLMGEALQRAAALGHQAVLLVGDAPYYQRFGFEQRYTRGLSLPGPVEEARFLGLELTPGALVSAKGIVEPTGALDLATRQAQQNARAHRTAMDWGSPRLSYRIVA